MSKKNLIKYMHNLLDHTIYLGKTLFGDKSARNEEIAKICCISLLIKAMHKAHSINVLITEGMLEESKIILRVLIEVSFVTGAIENNPDFAIKYGKSACTQRLRNFKNIQKSIEQNIPNLKVSSDFRKRLERDIEYFRDQKKDEKSKEIKIFDYAKEADLLVIYYTSYSYLCSSVHSGPEDLEPYFSKRYDGSIFKISSPSKDDEELIMFSAIETMIRILETLTTIFTLESEELREVQKEYQKINLLLWEKLKPNEYFST